MLRDEALTRRRVDTPAPVDDRLDAVHERLAETIDSIRPHLRGWLHAAAAPLAFLSLLVTLVLAEDVRVRIALVVFMISAVLTFSTSAAYHLRTWSPRHDRILKRMDHANIYVLIAGSSTPFAVLLLDERNAVVLLAIMWAGALLGVVFKVVWVHSPRSLQAPLYLVLGWAPVAFVGDFIGATVTPSLVLLAAGGGLYTIGAVVYALQRPNPSPAYFGYHEVFHGLTVLAFFAHCVGVGLLVR